MKTKADKTNSAGQSRAVANRKSKPRKREDATFGFVDNRPAAIAQRKFQEAIDNSPRLRQHGDTTVLVSESAVSVAQRRQLEGLFGVPAQRRGVLDEKASQMMPIQRDANAAQNYSPPAANAMRPSFRTNHAPNTYDLQTALNIHGTRGLSQSIPS